MRAVRVGQQDEVVLRAVTLERSRDSAHPTIVRRRVGPRRPVDSAHRAGRTTPAAPPPRRTGSAAASSGRAEELDAGGRADLAGRRRDARTRGPSAVSAARGACRTPAPPARRGLLRWLARGAASACGSVMPRSSRSTRICSTVVMIVAPPGEPSASSGLPSSSTIVGDIDAARPLAGAGQVRVGRRPARRREVEVGELVVEQEAAAGHDDAAAAGLTRW